MSYNNPIRHIAKHKSKDNYLRKIQEIGKIDNKELKKAKNFVDNLPLYHCINFRNFKRTPTLLKEGICSVNMLNNKKKENIINRTFEFDKNLGLDNYVFLGALRPYSVDPLLLINPEILNSEETLVTPNDIITYHFPHPENSKGFKSCSSIDELLKKSNEKIKEYSDDLLIGPHFKEYFARKLASQGLKYFKEEYFSNKNMTHFEVKVLNKIDINQIIGIIPNRHSLSFLDIPIEKKICVRTDTLRKGLLGKLFNNKNLIVSREEFAFERVKKERGLESKLN